MVAAAAATSILSLCSSSPAFADSDAGGATKGSPGVLSGNDVQVPVDVPVNACGNSVDAIALLNPAFGNSCANDSGSPKGGSYGEPYGGGDSGYGSGHDRTGSGSSTHGRSEGSPGVGSGNHAGAPVDVPVNACGNTVDVISGLNPAFGDHCGGYGDEHTAPPYGGEDTPTPTPPGYGDHPTPTPTPTPSGPPGPPGHPTPTPTPTPPGYGDQPSPTPTPTQPGHGGPPSSPGHQGPPPHLPDTGSNSEALLAASGASAALIAAGAVLYRRGRNASHR
ncbi:LPXTG-motif cell wall-anchored protein [Streptomyces sp. TLI_55]|nr:LPXTG-motif cell wall-anchored protein [Streptomyces sp. TLI_55]